MSDKKRALIESLERLNKKKLLLMGESTGLSEEELSKSDKKNIAKKIANKVSKSKFLPNGILIDINTKEQEKCVEKMKKYGVRIKDIDTEGGYGAISKICYRKNSCPYVVKAQNFTFYDDSAYRTEIKLLKRLKDSGLTPKVIDYWECQFKFKIPGVPQEKPPLVGYIVMERWDGNLKELIKKQNGLKRSQLLEIIEIIKKLHTYDIIHHDTHLGNIMYKYYGKNNDKIKFSLIDFGTSFDLREKTVGRYVPYFNGKSFYGKLNYDLDFLKLKETLLTFTGVDASDLLDPYINPINIYPRSSEWVSNSKLLL